MRIEFIPDDSTAKELAALVEERRDDALVQVRRRQSLLGRVAQPDRSEFWKAIVMGLLTSQQRSGPGSAVNRLLAARPFPLGYDRLVESGDVQADASSAFKEHGGIRFSNIIAKRVEANLSSLTSDGGWEALEDAASPLWLGDHSFTDERGAAQALQLWLRGIGPKQSRNVLQYLGLTKWEVPVDSRIAKWLRTHGFPLPTKGGLLSNEEYYCLVLDAFRTLCAQAGVVPCVADAAIFTAVDGKLWTEEDLV